MKNMKYEILIVDTNAPNSNGNGSHTVVKIRSDATTVTDSTKKDEYFNRCFVAALGEFMEPIVRICMAMAGSSITMEKLPSDSQRDSKE